MNTGDITITLEITSLKQPFHGIMCHYNTGILRIKELGKKEKRFDLQYVYALDIKDHKEKFEAMFRRSAAKKISEMLVENG